MKRLRPRFWLAWDRIRISWSSRAEMLGGLSRVCMRTSFGGGPTQRARERARSIHPAFSTSPEALHGARATIDGGFVEKRARCASTEIVEPGRGLSQGAPRLRPIEAQEP